MNFQMLMNLKILGVFCLFVFLGKEEQNPTLKSTFNSYFSAMHEVDMIGFCVFLNIGIVNLSHTMSKRQLLKTWLKWQVVMRKKVNMFLELPLLQR